MEAPRVRGLLLPAEKQVRLDVMLDGKDIARQK